MSTFEYFTNFMSQPCTGVKLSPSLQNVINIDYLLVQNLTIIGKITLLIPSSSWISNPCYKLTSRIHKQLPHSMQFQVPRCPVTAHFIAPAQFVAGDKLYLRWQHISSPPCTIWRLATKCTAVVHTVLGWQNVPCKSAYFVVPHRMDLNIHIDIYLLNMKEAIYYIIWYVYIIFITYLHLH